MHCSGGWKVSKKFLFLSLVFLSLFLISNADAQVCSNGAFQCGSNGQEKCVNGNWRLWNSCSYGCSGGYCNPGAGQLYGLDPNYVPPAADPCAGQCSLGALQCGSSGNQEKCVSGGSCNIWTAWNTCFNGCSGGYCNAAPSQPSGTAPEPVVQPAPVVVQPTADLSKPNPVSAAPAKSKKQSMTMTLPAPAGKPPLLVVCEGVFDFDGNGVTFSDFVEFVKKYQANNLEVDYNLDGTANIQDFFCFRSYFLRDISWINC